MLFGDLPGQLFVYFPVGGMAMSNVCHIFHFQLMAIHLQEAEVQEEADRRNHLIFMQSAIGSITIKADRRNHLISSLCNCYSLDIHLNRLQHPRFCSYCTFLQCCGSASVSMRIGSIFFSERIQIRIQGAKPLRIHADPCGSESWPAGLRVTKS